MIETFTALLLAHALADFVLQTAKMVETKRRPATLLLHGAIVLFTAQAAVGTVTHPALLALAAVHIATDAIKTYLLPQGLTAFVADQAAHVAAIVVVAWLAPDLFATGLWGGIDWMPGLMALTAGLILTTRAGGFAVGLLMAPWGDIDALPKGLPNGGYLIGVLERALVFLFVMVGQPAGIGFLIAAKSVLRFDTAKDDQRAGEYVIVGTLASFGWALAATYATTALLRQLPPLGILPVAP